MLNGNDMLNGNLFFHLHSISFNLIYASTTMANSYHDIEERIQDALQELSEPGAPPVTKDCKETRRAVQETPCTIPRLPIKVNASSYKPKAYEEQESALC